MQFPYETEKMNQFQNPLKTNKQQKQNLTEYYVFCVL